MAVGFILGSTALGSFINISYRHPSTGIGYRKHVTIENPSCSLPQHLSRRLCLRRRVTSHCGFDRCVTPRQTSLRVLLPPKALALLWPSRRVVVCYRILSLLPACHTCHNPTSTTTDPYLTQCASYVPNGYRYRLPDLPNRQRRL